MTVGHLLTDALLVVTVLACWTGVFGMLRVREPMQALHYLGVPATVGSIALTGAVLCETGLSSSTFKTGLIAVLLLIVSSVGTHATARALRMREIGHWEPINGDSIEFVPKEDDPEETKR